MGADHEYHESSSAALHDWRSYGEHRRQALVEQDEANTSFYLNPSCPIARYFELAERVVNQFRSQCASLESASSSALEDTYVMGHRLIAFLSLALPQHPGYLSVTVSANRNNTFRDLVWINEQMDEIALKIDEEQLNKFISLEFDPVPEDPEDEDDERGTGTIGISPLPSGPAKKQHHEVKPSWNLFEIEQQSSWESFPSWSAGAAAADVPNTADTDTSSFESELNNTIRDASDSKREDVATQHFVPSSIVSMGKAAVKKEKKHVKFQLDEIDPTVGKGDDRKDVSWTDQPDTSVYFTAEEHDESGHHQEEEVAEALDDSLYSYHDALHVSEFLRTIAEEDVRYENDSEANDSWAQDGGESRIPEDSDVSAGGSTLTCDPARLALRDIMNKARNSQDSGHPFEESRTRNDQWAAFDFASTRQAIV